MAKTKFRADRCHEGDCNAIAECDESSGGFGGDSGFGQSAQPGTTPGVPILNLQGLAGRKGTAGNRTATDPQGLVALRERVADMESTLSQMRGVLKQMHAKAAKSKPTDPLTKANLDLWELMVGQLDKDPQQLRQTLAAREDLEARRAALYKQAEKNATRTPTPAATEHATGQSTERSPVAQAAPAQPSAAPRNQ